MSKSYTIVTGAGGSIGQAITRALANEGHNVIMACRNLEKDTPVCNKINEECRGEVTIAHLDLASFDSIKKFAQFIQEANLEIEALINNAGVMNKNYKTTHEGYEMTIGVNFIGTYLLTELLKNSIKKGGHITFTTSLTRFIGKIGHDFFQLNDHNYTRFKAYSNSKYATTIYASNLAQELTSQGIYVNAADPGIVDSGMIHMDSWVDPIADALFRPIISSPQKGATSALNANASQTCNMIFTGKHKNKISKQFAQHPLSGWLMEETHKIVSPWLSSK